MFTPTCHPRAKRRIWRASRAVQRFEILHYVQNDKLEWESEISHLCEAQTSLLPSAKTSLRKQLHFRLGRKLHCVSNFTTQATSLTLVITKKQQAFGIFRPRTCCFLLIILNVYSKTRYGIIQHRQALYQPKEDRYRRRETDC